MVWNRNLQAWNVTIGESAAVLTNPELNGYYSAEGIFTELMANNFLERFNCYAIPNKSRPLARANTAEDTGLYHGVSTQIQDYLNERQEELS
jgi:hypothetical protein